MLPRPAVLESAKQAIKTAIAGVISLYVTNLFHLPQGYWAAISALIVMQSNVGATLTASRTRLAGTAVGAAVGGLFVSLWGANTWGFALAVAIAF
ncbi:MAG TPA: FUSC family protein, partial [Bryobacteraceae bacterium]|nr:FUSC family protein [Bryobacteraceae bacterium]